MTRSLTRVGSACTPGRSAEVKQRQVEVTDVPSSSQPVDIGGTGRSERAATTTTVATTPHSISFKPYCSSISHSSSRNDRTDIVLTRESDLEEVTLQ